LEEELGAAHLRHALVHQEERDLVAPLEELVQGLEGLGAGGRLDDAVVRTEVMPEVPLDGFEDLAIVIDGEQDGLLHGQRSNLPRSGRCGQGADRAGVGLRPTIHRGTIAHCRAPANRKLP
jgi:hypothetical protein